MQTSGGMRREIAKVIFSSSESTRLCAQLRTGG